MGLPMSAGVRVWAVCALWCPRQLVEVQYVGVVKDHGWMASLYVCAPCLERVHRTAAHVETYGQQGRCWLWCGGHPVPGSPAVSVGRVEIAAGPRDPPHASADLYACTGCIRLISLELQRLAHLRDGCPPASGAQEYSPGGHLAPV
ncbi:hypothetical protein ACFYVL_08810 [Streptomyces sp. NPDC004111]|uniref:hypothetical protein n=1 Tax=Streptomyces sp. NPDC004111 TaxID=3364690 RepID=UPI0036B4E254